MVRCRTCPEVQPWLYGYDAIKEVENVVEQNPGLFNGSSSKRGITSHL